MRTVAKFALLSVFLVLGVLPALAGTPILLIEGAVRSSGAKPETVRLDMDKIRSYGVRKISMKTQWFDEVHTFEVVDLSDILADYGLAGVPMVATALNNYSVTIPADAIDDAFLAVSMDGKPMSPASKGPLWVIFDFNDPKFANDVKYSAYSAWQLFKLTPAN